MSSPCEASDRVDSLDRVIAAYLEAAESGNTLDRAALLTDNPGLEEPLREYFAALDEVNTLVADLKPSPPSHERSPCPFGANGELNEIGWDGIGVVSHARQSVPDRMVALKMTRPGRWVTAADVRRLRLKENRPRASIQVIALQEAREQLNLFSHAVYVGAVSFSSDGRTIALAGSYVILRLWWVEDRRRRAIASLAFPCDGSLLVAGTVFPNGRSISVHDPGRPPG